MRKRRRRQQPPVDRALQRAAPAAHRRTCGGIREADRISVQTRANDGIVLADQLLQEGSSSPADVYLTENSPELEDLDQHGLLANLSASTLDQVPRRDEPPSGDWALIALRISGWPTTPAAYRALACLARSSTSPNRLGRAGSRLPPPTRTFRRWWAR
jgi:hypothetical protein